MSSYETEVSTAPAVKSKNRKSKVSRSLMLLKPALQRQNEVASDAESGQLVTKSGDNLSAIAKKMQVEGVSLDQMLVGL